MLKFVFLCCLSLGTGLQLFPTSPRPLSHCHGTWQPDYYWRDYHGVVPDDAVQGGYDLSGNITYIGQITIEKNIVLPGVINSGTKLMFVAYYGHRSHDNYVKILCSQHKEMLNWIPINIDDFHLLTDYYLVVGGFEPPRTAYIGRVNYDNNVIVGKVFSPQSGIGGLRIVKPNKEEQAFKSFEILGYERC